METACSSKSGEMCNLLVSTSTVFKSKSSYNLEAERRMKSSSCCEYELPDGQPDPNKASHQECSTGVEVMTANARENIDAISSPSTVGTNAEGAKELPFGEFMGIENILKALEECESPLGTIPCGQKNNCFFIIDNTVNVRRKEANLKRIFCDDMGAWTNTNLTYAHYLQAGKVLRFVYKPKSMNGAICARRKISGSKQKEYVPLAPQPGVDDLITVGRYYATLKRETTYHRRITWVEKNDGFACGKSVVEYKGECKTFQAHHGGNNIFNFQKSMSPLPSLTEGIKQKSMCCNSKRLHSELQNDSSCNSEMPGDSHQIHQVKHRKRLGGQQVAECIEKTTLRFHTSQEWSKVTNSNAVIHAEVEAVNVKVLYTGEQISDT